MGFFLLSPSRMSQLKHTAVLKGDVLQDVATGQLFKLHPTEEERQRGIWEYNAEADGAGGITSLLRVSPMPLMGVTLTGKEIYKSGAKMKWANGLLAIGLQRRRYLTERWRMCCLGWSAT